LNTRSVEEFLEIEYNSATLIQSIYKTYQARKLKNLLLDTKKRLAITKIQKVMRGQLARHQILYWR
jgi:hypothetical protein